MQDLLTEVGTLEARIAQCEREARDHEERARALRAERQECKVRLSEVHEAVNKAVNQKAIQDAAAAAQQSRVAADAAKAESLVVLDTLRGKQAELEAIREALATKQAQLEELIARHSAAIEETQPTS